MINVDFRPSEISKGTFQLPRHGPRNSVPLYLSGTLLSLRLAIWQPLQIMLNRAVVHKSDQSDDDDYAEAIF